MILAAANTFRAGLVQLRSGRAIARNMEMAEALIRRAAAEGAVYVQTPENTSIMELETDRLLSAIDTEGKSEPLRQLQALAKELGIWLHVGSLAMKLPSGKVANRSYLITPQGEIAARYDKLHMFDVDLAGGESYRESRNFDPGNKAVLADLPWGRLGLSICYDLRFPALYRALASAGADIIAVPAAFTKQTGEAHWRVLLRARAIETGAYVLAAAQGGLHENGRSTYGHSMIVSPWGEVLAEAGEDPQILLADIDLGLSAETRAKIPSLKHGREFEVEIGGAKLPPKREGS
ncbi:MAG: carbon-nitrogen hydrolase family protein [Methyloceanibacter sp.]|jgi:predicted amidohydrolase|uniref:carbon-nitrogen hydrolase family protein n=1 Tax=Methyloceanibacter sp. TaxID=1965321 RepID=UPI003C7063BE